MSVAAARFAEPRLLVAAGLIGVAAIVGALAGFDPKLGLAAAFGLAFVLVAIANLATGVAVFAALTFVELAPEAGGTFSLAKIAGLAIGISWIAAAASERGRSRLFFAEHPLLTGSLVFFLAWATLSGLWAEDPAATWTAVGRFALNAALFAIVFTAIRRPRHLYWAVAGLLCGACFAAIYGLVIAPNLSATADSITPASDLNRVSGTVGDPNLLASVLVVGVVMAFAMALDLTRSSLVRLACVGIALLCMAGIFATVSRGGMLALGAAMLASLALAGPRRGRLLVVASFAVVAALAYFTLFASQAQIDRLTTSDGGTGRTDIWKIGWRMVEDRPLQGIGAGNFPVSSIHYLLIQPGEIQRSDFIVDDPKVAHNAYLEVLAEMGVPGLILFLAIIAISLATAIRAARVLERRGEDGLALLACAIAVSLIAILCANFFLSDQFGKVLWLLLALGPAALAIATRLEREERQPLPGSAAA